MSEEPTTPSRLPLLVLPVVTAGVAVAVGAVIGGLVGWFVGHQPPVVQEVPRELTPEELAAACSPLVNEATSRLEEAQVKVNTLERQVIEKENRVHELESEMTRRAERGQLLVAERNQLQKELEAARAELATVKAELEVALEEKKQLIEELKVTKEELVVRTEEARVAREDSLDNKWATFRNEAQLLVCEKGRRKKMGDCRTKVQGVLDDEMGAKYRHCIRSGQAVPSLHEAAKDETLPDFALWLDQEDRITKDWYILLCDPTLPEAADLKEVEHLLKVKAGPDDDDSPWTPEPAPADPGALRPEDVDLGIEDLDAPEGKSR